MHVVLTFCIKPGCFARWPLCHEVNLPSSVARRPLCQGVNLPSSVARQPLCHKVNLPSCVARRPLCHKVNLLRYEAHRRHFIITCDIYGTEINKLNKNTEKVNEVSRTHIPLRALMNDSLENCEIERCNVSEPLNAYVCKESRRDKYKITKQRRHRRIRDREPSRILVRRVIRKLKKRTARHRLKCCV